MQKSKELPFQYILRHSRIILWRIKHKIPGYGRWEHSSELGSSMRGIAILISGIELPINGYLEGKAGKNIFLNYLEEIQNMMNQQVNIGIKNIFPILIRYFLIPCYSLFDFSSFSSDGEYNFL